LFAFAAHVIASATSASGVADLTFLDPLGFYILQSVTLVYPLTLQRSLLGSMVSAVEAVLLPQVLQHMLCFHHACSPQHAATYGLAYPSNYLLICSVQARALTFLLLLLLQAHGNMATKRASQHTLMDLDDACLMCIFKHLMPLPDLFQVAQTCWVSSG
jgi:hypothetical protein